MTRIVHITTVHPRSDTRIFRKVCSTLQGAGYDVHLVVADGKGDANVGGVHLHDVGGTRGRLKRMLLLPLRALSRVGLLKAAVVHFHDPELLPIGLALQMLGYKVVYDAHEDLPRAILSKHWIRPQIRRIVSVFFEWAENFCARRFSAVVTATPHIAKRFRELQPETISVTNYPVISDTASAPSRRPEDRTFFYVGGITRKRAAREMIVAIELAGARLILAGPFEDPALAADLAAMPQWKNVEYCGVVDHDSIWEMMSRSLAGLLLFHPEPNHINSVPNKMFEYMAGGIPVVCSDFEDWRKVVVENDIGITCDPLDPQSIAAAMRQIIDDPEAAEAMGRRGREVVMTKYRWENEAAKLVALYDRLLRVAS